MKKRPKENIIYAFLIVILVFLSILLSNKSYTLKGYQGLEHKETIATSYRVYLDDDSYFNTSYLEEDMQYISSIIDYVDVTFSYIDSFKDNLTYDVKTKAEAIITIVDSDDKDKVIYKSTEVIDNKKYDTSNSKTINKVKNFKINYSKYNHIANEFKKKYGITAKCNLRINYYVSYNGNYKGLENISRSNIMYVDIPLSEQMITISKNKPSIKDDIYKGKTTNTITNIVLYISAIVCDLIALVLLIILINDKIKINKLINNFDKYINKILKQYDAYITEAEHETSNKENNIQIKTFRELLDVRNNTNKTIVYIRIDDNTAKFETIDDNTLYYYIAKREDFE